MKRAIFSISVIPALLITALVFSCAGKDDSIPQGSYAIIIQGYTPLRIDPMVFSGIVKKMDTGDTVRVLEKSAEESWVGRTSGYWYRVRTREGITGWVFAADISIHTSSDSGAMEKIITGFMEAERAKIKQYLAGKWWSTNQFGDFTDHCLELYESQKYRSYRKGEEGRQIIGSFSIDFNKNEISFSDGTSFQSNLDLEKRGADYIIKRELKDFELRFTKISIETSPEPVIKETVDRKKPAPTPGNTPQ